MPAASPIQINTNNTAAQSRSKTVAPVSPIVSSAYAAYKKKTMSITQTYFLAHKARGKLSTEAARPDHNLRLLVGHANLLDSLMLELADAEREQESWFNQSVRGASSPAEHHSQNRHIKWADTVVEEPEEDWQAEDADSDSDSDSESDFDDDEDVEMVDAVVALRRVPSNKLVPSLHRQEQVMGNMEEDDEVEEDDEEDYAALTLTRSPSHSSSPPELDLDSDSSEDESMPPSPPTTVLPTFSEKQKESIATSAYYGSRTEDKDAFYDEGYYLPPRNPARLVSAISVY